MLDRPYLKQQAKGLLQVSKPSALLVGGVYVALGAVVSFLSSRLIGVSYEVMERALRFYSAGQYEYALSVLTAAQPSASSWLINLALELVMLIVGVGFTIFILNTVRGTGPALGNLLDGFGFPFRILLLHLVMGVFVALWSLLLVIPGIIASYRYSMAVYVLIDHPDYGVMECIRESKRITDGHKKELFLLDVSFLGWLLLSGAPFIGYLVSILATPYMALTHALYYERLSGRVMEPREPESCL